MQLKSKNLSFQVNWPTDIVVCQSRGHHSTKQVNVRQESGSFFGHSLTYSLSQPDPDFPLNLTRHRMLGYCGPKITVDVRICMGLLFHERDVFHKCYIIPWKVSILVPLQTEHIAHRQNIQRRKSLTQTLDMLTPFFEVLFINNTSDKLLEYSLYKSSTRPILICIRPFLAFKNVEKLLNAFCCHAVGFRHVPLKSLYSQSFRKDYLIRPTFSQTHRLQ